MRGRLGGGRRMPSGKRYRSLSQTYRRNWTGCSSCDWLSGNVTTPNTQPLPADLEIKDSQLIFNRVWKGLEDSLGRENLRFPRELILLGGAPGSGKGTNTDFIRKVRDISAQPIVVSQLLDSPEARKIKAGGGMVGDEEVLRLLFQELLKPEFRDSAVLDGFPRTKVQVECLQMFYDQMVLLRREFSGTPEAHCFRQPVFHIMVLFVDEAESIARQLKRGEETLAHNAEVRHAGTGELEEERETDFDPDLARNRYRTFKEKTFDALVSLKQIFHYHFINAQAPVEVVQENIIRELEYQKLAGAGSPDLRYPSAHPAGGRDRAAGPPGAGEPLG